MNLEERLNLRERNHDWQGLQETLEQGIASAEDPARQAEYHLRLGRLLRGRFLQGVKALKHFQDAFKLNSSLVEALAEAREIYWELGKLNMVQKLLELQLKNSEGAQASALFCQLGDVLRRGRRRSRDGSVCARAASSARQPDGRGRASPRRSGR